MSCVVGEMRFLFVHNIDKMRKVLLLLLLLPVVVSGQVIETIAGNGSATFSGDGGTALLAGMKPNTLTFDKTGNIFFVDAGNCRIRKINTYGIVTTIAGSSGCSYSGDERSATDANLYDPVSIAIDTSGNIYTSTAGDHRIRKISTSGIITTIAGTGISGYNGDNIPATAAQLFYPYISVVDTAGNILICDYDNHRVRKITPEGMINTIAGGSSAGHSGDGGPAMDAQLRTPSLIAYSSSGDLYVSDNVDRCIRRISALGIITTFAGTPGVVGNTGDSGPATNATFTLPNGLALDDTGNLYIADYGASVIRKVNTSGIISTIGGTGTAGFSGDGGSAILAKMTPNDVAVNNGNIYFADLNNNRIRKISYSSLGIGKMTQTYMTISLSPNPATNELTIKCPNEIESVEVINMMGQVVVYQACKHKEVVVNVPVLPAGVYFVKVNGPDGYRDGGRFVKE